MKMEENKNKNAKNEEKEFENWIKYWNRFERDIEEVVKNNGFIIIRRRFNKEIFNWDGYVDLLVNLCEKRYEFGNIIGLEEDIHHLLVYLCEKYGKRYFEKYSKFISIIFIEDKNEK